MLYAPLARVQSPKLPRAAVDAAMEALADHYRRRLQPLVQDVDIVHSVHGGVSYLGYAALQTARDLRLPFVHTPLLHLQQDVAAGSSTAPLALRLIPRTWTDHYWKRIWLQADAVLTMTGHERDHYIREGVPGARVFQTGVGPMLPTAAASQPLDPAPAGEPMVLFLARNTLAKGLADVVHAAPLVWQHMPHVRFVIAGPRTPETDALLDQAVDPRMEVLGEVSDERKDALLRRCTVYCMPSREESLGATYLEAWSYGKPVIGLRIPPLEELTGGGRGGLLVEPDPADVAAKIRTLLANPALMREMGQWGQRQVRERYSWEAIVARTEAVYESLLGGVAGPPARTELAAMS
jgi:glycosyltransferase involved in cell wall biosynthesis